MSLTRHAAAGLVCLAFVAAAPAAEPTASPLRLLPAKTDVLIEIPQPRKFVEAATTLDALKQLQQLGIAKEFLDSTQYRRFYQLVAYFEKELGVKWPELLDQLAGNGAAISTRIGNDPAPALLVIQGKDEKLMQRFVKLAIDVLTQEIARQEGQEKLVVEKYQGVETYHVGKDFNVARVGATLILANNKELLIGTLDRHSGKDKTSLSDVKDVEAARKLLPKEPLASLWINMEPVLNTPQGKEFYKRPRDFTLTLLAGSLVDVVSRAPYVAAGVYQEKDGFVATVRIPKGREGMGPEAALHLAPEGKPGTRPLLEPRGVVFSNSFYLDVSRLWEDRNEFLGEQQAKAFEAFDKQSGQFLSGIKVSKLLQDAGAYHRVVVVNQPKVGYKTTPKTSIPAFAVVTEMRDPEAFTKSVSTALRGGALLFSTTQTKADLVEEKVGDVTLVGYRFPEDGVYKQDVNDVRFNFSPCFARVGNQFFVASTLELGREMVGLLAKEAKEKGPAAVSNQKFFAAGVADILAATEDQLVTQAILGQALTPDDAKAQVRQGIDILRRLGDTTIQSEYQKNEFRFDLRIKTTK